MNCHEWQLVNAFHFWAVAFRVRTERFVHRAKETHWLVLTTPTSAHRVWQESYPRKQSSWGVIFKLHFQTKKTTGFPPKSVGLSCNLNVASAQEIKKMSLSTPRLYPTSLRLLSVKDDNSENYKSQQQGRHVNVAPQGSRVCRAASKRSAPTWVDLHFSYHSKHLSQTNWIPSVAYVWPCKYKNQLCQHKWA